jgi:hypothetical protein
VIIKFLLESVFLLRYEFIVLMVEKERKKLYSVGFAFKFILRKKKFKKEKNGKYETQRAGISSLRFRPGS